MSLPLEGRSEALIAQARQVRGLVLDVDGVFTDGRLWYGPEGEALKAMDTRDGHGLVLLRFAKIPAAVLSGRPQALLHRRFKELRLAHVEEACHEKGAGVERVAEALGLPLDSLAFMGDDVNDLPALAKVGLSACPADAAPEVRAAAEFVSARPGGRGAIRELCELILAAQGQWPPRYER